MQRQYNGVDKASIRRGFLFMIDFDKLKTIDQIKGTIKTVFTDEQLLEMARKKLIPHYVLTNPLTEVEIVCFDPGELRDWFYHNCMVRHDTKLEQKLNIISFDYDLYKFSKTDLVPCELTKVQNLFKLPLSNITTPPGIYFLCQDTKISYVGQAVNVCARILQHMSEDKKEFNQVYFIPCHQDQLAVFERALIRVLNPPYNQKLRQTPTEVDVEICHKLSVEKPDSVSKTA